MTPNGCTRGCSCSPLFRSPDPREGRSTRFRNSRSASRLVVRVVDLPGSVKDVSGYLDKHTESDLAALIEAVPAVHRSGADTIERGERGACVPVVAGESLTGRVSDAARHAVDAIPGGGEG